MKCLLYCTIALPWLYQGADGKWYVTKSKCAQVGCKPARNGYVSFECDCKEAFQLVYGQYPTCEQEEMSDNFSGRTYIPDDLYGFKEKGTCLSVEQLVEYGNGKEDIFAYHFESVKPIEPMPITQLYKDEACTIPLTRAPQSYCFAYRKTRITPCGKEEEEMLYRTESTPFEENGISWIIEKVLVFSVRSPWLCKIANGEKDLEVRKTRIANAGIEYK